MISSRVLLGSIAAALVAAGSGCNGSTPRLTLVGTVERTLVEVVAAASEQIVSVEVERGQRVEVGQVLVRLDATFAEAAEARVEAELAAARTAAAIARQDHGRLVTLCEGGVASDQQCERAVLERDEAAARLHAAEASLAAAAKRRSDHVMTAPVAGLVDQLPFDQGERVPAGGVVAVLIADGAPWVRVWIPERVAVQVQPGTRALVSVDGIESELHGRVLVVSREPEFTPHYALTERERMHLVYEARLEIEDGPSSLRAGLPADVVFPSIVGQRPHSP